MNTSPRIDSCLPAVDEAATQLNAAVLWHHAAFCGLGLPLRTPRAAWQRSAGGVTVRIEPGTGEVPLPAGPMLRLVLLHVCDAAFRAESPVVALGADAPALAASLGVADARALAEQVERILAARMIVATEGGPDLAVFDARGRPRAAGAWRASVRLASGFAASLAAQAVPLDRAIVSRLAETPLAFDAYAWIRATLHRTPAEATVTVGWDELFARFAAPAQDAPAFRTAFESALRAVFEADLSIALAVDDEGVGVRHAVETADAAETAAEPTPTPMPEPAAEITPDPAPAPPPAPPETAAVRADEDEIEDDTISLRSHLTGLPQVIWLRRGYGEDSALVGVTPGTRFDPDRLTVLAVEPIVLEVSGGLGRNELGRVSAWIMANRDLIDDFWAGEITSHAEINRRIRKVPAPGWR
jgi:hypothetical protein